MCIDYLLKSMRVIMVQSSRRALSSWIVAATIAAGVLSANQASGSVFYNYTTIIRTGQAGLTAMNGGPSINDSGQVAFSGQVTGGQSVFFVNYTSSSPKNITPGFVSSN